MERVSLRLAAPCRIAHLPLSLLLTPGVRLGLESHAISLPTNQEAAAHPICGYAVLCELGDDRLDPRLPELLKRRIGNQLVPGSALLLLERELGLCRRPCVRSTITLPLKAAQHHHQSNKLPLLELTRSVLIVFCEDLLRLSRELLRVDISTIVLIVLSEDTRDLHLKLLVARTREVL